MCSGWGPCAHTPAPAGCAGVFVAPSHRVGERYKRCEIAPYFKTISLNICLFRPIALCSRAFVVFRYTKATKCQELFFFILLLCDDEFVKMGLTSEEVCEVTQRQRKEKDHVRSSNKNCCFDISSQISAQIERYECSKQ